MLLSTFSQHNISDSCQLFAGAWSTFWRGNIGTTAKKPAAGLFGMFGMSWTFGMYHTFGICAIRHIRKSERFRKCLTKSHGFDIIIVQRETLKIFNSKRWTGAARYIYIYNVYAREKFFQKSGKKVLTSAGVRDTIQTIPRGKTKIFLRSAKK